MTIHPTITCKVHLKILRVLCSIFLPVLLMAFAKAAENAETPAPAAEPFIFWAHYMPMVPHGHQLAHPHSGGNFDAWPFVTQHPELLDDCKEDIRQALESGINGFQMLAMPSEAMYEAARQIRQETGQLFFVEPLWLDPQNTENVKKRADDVEAFLHNHANDPHVYHLNGEQLHFVWNTGPDDAIKKLDSELKRRGLKVTLAPTLVESKKLNAIPDWPNSTPWKAGQTWEHGAPDLTGAKTLQRKIANSASRYLYSPAICSGYDSSNRPGQAIHTHYNGLKTLLQSLQVWTGLGFRQMGLVTWNDPQETLEIPSSRNIWGHNLILKFFRGIGESGKSPLADPGVVVSYPVELLYGDQLFFQVVGLPPADAETEWRAEVSFVPIGQSSDENLEVMHGHAQAQPNKVSFIEMYGDASRIFNSIPAVQPVVKVEYRQAKQAKWKTLNRNKKLPPIQLRYNLVQYPVPYAIDLSRVAETPSLKLDVLESQPFDQAKLRVFGSREALQKVVLCEGSRSLGSFRDEPKTSKGDGALFSNIFVRIEASEDLPLNLAVEGGTIHDLYTPYGNLDKSFQRVEGVAAQFMAYPPGGEWRSRVARLDLNQAAHLSLALSADPTKGILRASLDELKNGVAKTFPWENRVVTLRMVFTTDATEPLVDFPLSHKAVSRDLPLHLDQDGPKLLYAMGLLKSGKVVLSKPIWVGSPKKDAPVTAQWIATGKPFDSFVNPSSAVSLNPFSEKDIRTSLIPMSRVPFFHLDLEEGAGPRLNDRGTSQQAGRAFVESGGLKRDQTFEEESGGRYHWIDLGKKGKALQLGKDTVIRFRSKSAPVGPQTISLWVNVHGSKDAESHGWSTLQAGAFQLSMNADGTATLRFNHGDISVEKRGPLSLIDGWNHLAFVYDLASLKLYLNGANILTEASPKPVYQRTHQTPAIGFTTPARQGLGFTGEIDEIQVIGTGVDAADISKLSKGAVWRSLSE